MTMMEIVRKNLLPSEEKLRFLNGNFFKLTFFEFKSVLSSKIEGFAKINTFSIETTVWTDKKLKTLLNTIENYNFKN